MVSLFLTQKDIKGSLFSQILINITPIYKMSSQKRQNILIKKNKKNKNIWSNKTIKEY